jgi:hypothetical protein
VKRVEVYLRHVEQVGGPSPEYHVMSEANEPLISAIVFRGVPQSGALTSFSYGLSLVPHHEWVSSRPELVLSVDSTDIGWALAPGELVRRGRGRVPFSYGSILNFGQAIAADSAMSSFVVYACGSIDQRDCLVELPEANVNLVQVYPIYESEAALVERVGAERFLGRLGPNVYNVQRAPLSLPGT